MYFLHLIDFPPVLNLNAGLGMMSTMKYGGGIKMKKTITYFDEHLIVLGMIIGSSIIGTSWIAYSILNNGIINAIIMSLFGAIILTFSIIRFNKWLKNNPDDKIK